MIDNVYGILQQHDKLLVLHSMHTAYITDASPVLRNSCLGPELIAAMLHYSRCVLCPFQHWLGGMI